MSSSLHRPLPSTEIVDEAVPDITLEGSPEALTNGFADLGVLPETVEALEKVGITHPFAIQALTLPIALGGADLIGQARTGTGKTLGFGIPLLQRLDTTVKAAPQALVVVPTRELCIQVAKDLQTAGSTRELVTLAIYGGRAYEPQVEALRAGVHVVVGTPGRLLDLAERGDLRLSEVRCLVLDEADEMLDLGFLPDVERILTMVNGERQTMLFSATMPGPVVALARKFMNRPTHVRAELPDENRTVPTTSQHIYRAHNLDKPEMVARLLQARGRGLAMVFCRTKRTCDKVAAELVDRGFAAAAVHGDLGQGAREQALRAFRAGKVDVLVATDVAARGIDVSGVTHVVNYQCPEEEKTYLHRIGRTGRAGGSGVAVTLVDWDDVPRWNLINKALDLPFHEPPETYSSSPWFYSDLDIPEGTKGRLPRSQRVRAGLDAEQVEDLGETGRGRSRSGAGGRSGPGGRGPRTDRPARADRPEVGEGDSDRPQRSRNRRRTRGAGAAAEAVGATEHASSTSASAGDDTDTDGAPRRRRRRGGRGRSAAAVTEGAAATD